MFEDSIPRRLLRAATTVRIWRSVKRHMTNPPPSNFIFYLLIASNIWFAFQVEMQSTIIKNQMILIDYFVSLAFKGK